jgi:hypothetical protein
MLPTGRSGSHPWRRPSVGSQRTPCCHPSLLYPHPWVGLYHYPNLLFWQQTQKRSTASARE